MMWEAFIIGLFSGMITNLGLLVIERTTLDDPCGAFIAHGLNGIWGLLAVGIFGKTDHENMDIPGLLYGGIVQVLKLQCCQISQILFLGDFYLIGVQLLSAVIIATWSALYTYLLLTVSFFKIKFISNANYQKNQAKITYECFLDHQ